MDQVLTDIRSNSSVTTIVELFAAQAEKNSDAIALQYGDSCMTYGELHQQSSQLAFYILSKKIKPGAVVGICFEPGFMAIIALLAVVKARCSYLPLDPQHLQHRAEHMLNDAQVAAIITSSSQQDLINICANGKKEKVIVILTDRDCDKISAVKQNDSLLKPSPEDVAYIMYTSGSTGTPKGVLIPHKAITRLVHEPNYIQILPEDRIAQGANLAFDAATFEIWGALSNGACLVIIPRETLFAPQKFATMLLQQKISILWLTAGLFNQLVAIDSTIFANLRYLLVGGEALSVQKIKKVLQQKDKTPRKLLNGYGPTECTTFATTYEIKLQDLTRSSVPIGKPINKTEIYILNDKLQQVPKGQIGELYLGGDGVACGYLNNSQLTAERFINNPFKSEESRLYKTGDLVRKLVDGNLDFIGRADRQVKMRGFRIELGEIEYNLLQHEAIQQCVVNVISSKRGSKSLVAYMVLSSKAESQFDKLYQFLCARLPAYMIPGKFYQVDSIPLDANGKVNYEVLSQSNCQLLKIKKDHVLPNTKEEKIIAKVLAEILEIPISSISVDDNFFSLGMHSLNAIAVVFALNQALNINLNGQVLFDNPNIRQLALCLSECNQTEIAISAEKQQNDMSLSLNQEPVWTHEKLMPDNPIYNETFFLELQEEIDFNVMQQSINQLIERHEMLRMQVFEDNGQVVQRIAPYTPVELICLDLSDLSVENQEKQVVAETRQIAQKIFNLSAELPIKFRLFCFHKNHYRLLIVAHHLAIDGVSMFGIFIAELEQIYKSLSSHAEVSLPKLPIQYSNFISYQKKNAHVFLSKESEDFWRQILKNYQVLTLPVIKQHNDDTVFFGNRVCLELDEVLVSKLSKIAKVEKTTLFIVLLTAFNVLLSYYTGQNDIAIGSVVSARDYSQVQHIIGNFLNMLILRNKVELRSSFKQLLHLVHTNTIASYKHKNFPYQEVLKIIGADRIGCMPISAALVMEPKTNRAGFNWELDQLKFHNGTTKFDLMFELDERNSKIIGRVEYNTRLFDRVAIERMIAHFRNLLLTVAQNPEIPLTDLTLLTSHEKKILIDEWNNTHIDYPQNQSLNNLFEQQSQLTPQKTALIFRDKKLTYEQLNQKANQLAHYLKKQGVEVEDLVPICFERGIEMIVSILAILKLGAAYVPMDADFPISRINYIIDDANAKLILTQQTLSEKVSQSISNGGAVMIAVDELTQVLAEENNVNLQQNISPHNLAYVIYTSGSTGKPKGVLVEHKGAVNCVFTTRDSIKANDGDRFLAITSLTFDVSVLDYFLPFAIGAEVVIASEIERKDGVQSLQLLQNYNITAMQATPCSWNMLLNCGWQGDKDFKILTAGEPLTDGLAMSLQQCGQVYNIYGPTEATIYTSFKHMQPSDEVTIGKPMANIKTYVLDQFLQPVPIGIAGELYIGGAGVAQGYLNRPQLTKEKFIVDPFSDENRAKLYKTGDLVRWLPKGEIEFIGRIDNQVKIRGYRIELGEIENNLLNYDLIENCAVIVCEDGTGTKTLVAYLTSRENQPVNVLKLREFLVQSLPEYMIPVVFQVLPEMPLMSSGKIDRIALANMKIKAKVKELPGNETEMEIASLLCGLLKRDSVDVERNFFEIGVHSLIILQLCGLLNQRFGLNLQPVDLFTYHSVRLLARYIGHNHSEDKLDILAIKQRLAKKSQRSHSRRNRANEQVIYREHE